MLLAGAGGPPCGPPCGKLGLVPWSPSRDGGWQAFKSRAPQEKGIKVQSARVLSFSEVKLPEREV